MRGILNLCELFHLALTPPKCLPTDHVSTPQLPVGCHYNPECFARLFMSPPIQALHQQNHARLSRSGNVLYEAAIHEYFQLSSIVAKTPECKNDVVDIATALADVCSCAANLTGLFPRPGVQCDGTTRHFSPGKSPAGPACIMINPDVDWFDWVMPHKLASVGSAPPACVTAALAIVKNSFPKCEFVYADYGGTSDGGRVDVATYFSSV
ncbi:hypothetical protein H257_17319 [Aphanomyces astaci]|uniref:Uncharacterized protein n=1 Tax=Aphanomyces astaci TaxID=112090 RepID=W4FF86_APHAT|nr:hypothetical protein H257_17319 [Aphanomyces astaci]ETV66167.1 hypothetical protein H257_17319 [Aphanomyces astaci]|eukprot:XP_009844356.1 hypothetical protein H257_17319 [Aphanomyces astaci]